VERAVPSLRKTESEFADTRNYSTRARPSTGRRTWASILRMSHVAVEAANDGKVVWPSLGIYGNCVVLDHGYGLQSIYGLEPDRGPVRRNGEKGTGTRPQARDRMAGGDHLHLACRWMAYRSRPSSGGTSTGFTTASQQAAGSG